MSKSCFFVFFVSLGVLLTGPVWAADQPCTDSNFQGAYGALASGEFLVVPPGIPAGPTVRVGRVQVDGVGNARIDAVTSLNGFVLAESYGGTYSIDSDCTMNVTLLIPFPGAPQPIPFTFFGMLAENGQRADILLVNPPGSTVRISLRKQSRGGCSEQTLSGGYLLNMAGVNINQPGSAAGPSARLGRVVFDGRGGFTANTRVSIRGEISSQSFSGSYAITEACNVTMRYTAGESYTWTGVVVANGSGVNLIVSDPPGAAIGATLTRQTDILQGWYLVR
jgi:hypothetical protein